MILLPLFGAFSAYCLQCSLPSVLNCLQCLLPSVVWRCRLGGRKGIRPLKNWVMVICLEQDADLHMALQMPLPLTVSCFSKIQIGFTFLVLAYPGSPGQRAIKRVCVCSSRGWLGSWVVSVLDSGVEGPGFKSQSWRCRVTVLGKLFTPVVPLFAKQKNW